MDLSKVKDIFSGFLDKIKGLFGGLSSIKFPKNLPNFKTILDEAYAFFNRLWTSCYDNIQGIPFFQHIPEEKRKPFIIGAGGVCGLILILLLAILVNLGKKDTSSPALMAAGFVIPQEELFIPTEPDFVPDFLFEREPKRFWTIEDIRLYWRRPEASEYWREEIKSAIDTLMEGVP